MIRRIYLVARREYLAYVSAVGFWLSLILVPFFMSIGFVGPLLAERASPDRYYAVVADSPELEAAFTEGLLSGRRDTLEAAVRSAARLRGADVATERAAVAAVAQADDVDAGFAQAARDLGLPGVEAMQVQPFKFHRVPAPATSPDALRPYLTGERAVDTPDGPRPLFAALILHRDGQGQVGIDYWSSSLTDRTILNVAQRAMRDLMREEALAAAGVRLEAVERANQLAPEVTEYNPERRDADAEVTMADRMPYLAGMGLGFFLWIVVFSTVNILLTSVIEEKGNKILESLLASLRYHEILAGKLLGVAGVSATLLAVWGGFAAFGLVTLAGSGAPLPSEALSAVLSPKLLLPFAAYFVLGYLMFGSIFLAVGSLCETIQEAQTLMTPMIFILMVPMLLMPLLIRSPDAPIVSILSWVPLYTPFLMMVRLASGPPLYVVAGTSVLLLVSAVGIIWAAGNVFRAGVIGQAGPGSLKSLIGRLLRGGRARASGPTNGAGGAGSGSGPVSSSSR